MFKPWMIVLVAIPCLVLGVGCGQNALKYNNDMAGVTKEMESFGKDFTAQMQQNRGNQGKLKELHAEAVKKVTAIVQKGKALTPPDTTEGKALHQAFVAYLDTMDDNIRNELPKLLFESNPNAFAIAQQIDGREKEKHTKMLEAQRAFAKANNITLK